MSYFCEIWSSGSSGKQRAVKTRHYNPNTFHKLLFSVRTNPIPRHVPEQVFYTRPVPGIIMGGILPFGCIFIQLFFILNSIWSHQIYYMFGFLLLVALILIITCSETTILLCYFHLAAEDYNWWWRSFMTSGFTAVYFFVYAAHYYSSKVYTNNIFLTRRRSI